MTSGWHAATASLELFAHPDEDITELQDLRATTASAGWIGLTVAGALDA